MIAIRTDQEQSHTPGKSSAEQLAARFGLPLASELEQPPQLLLGWHDNKLALFPTASGPVFIDFVSGKLAHRRQFGGGKSQPLAKAIGLSGKKTPSVIDATAGMGRDSFVLACLGCQISMIERSPIIAALLEDGLQRAEEIAIEDPALSPVIERMTVINSDAVDYLNKADPVDVVYLDPMYPEKRKSAAVKKDMRVLQTLVGPDLDSDQLLNAALRNAIHRVVVKRPSHAEPLTDRKPNTAISSPNTRYDIYTLKSFSK
jgi:16S rRNA (guanine1516-N2)-methyltransferase